MKLQTIPNVACLLVLLVHSLASGTRSATEVAEGGSPHALASLQAVFESQIALADRIYESTKNEAAAILAMRAAFALCPSCSASQSRTDFVDEVFGDENSERNTLLEHIWPAVIDTKPLYLLFVGVHPQSLRYEYLLAEQGIVMSTIDANEAYSAYGAANRHVNSYVQEADRYFRPNHFDCVVMPAIIGWGIETEESLEAAVQALHIVLRPGGLLIVGYDKGNEVGCCQFEPYFTRVPLGTMGSKYEVQGEGTHHVFEFFRKELLASVS